MENLIDNVELYETLLASQKGQNKLFAWAWNNTLETFVKLDTENLLEHYANFEFKRITGTIEYYACNVVTVFIY